MLSLISSHVMLLNVLGDLNGQIHAFCRRAGNKWRVPLTGPSVQRNLCIRVYEINDKGDKRMRYSKQNGKVMIKVEDGSGGI
jgi:hypothetical protein